MLRRLHRAAAFMVQPHALLLKHGDALNAAFTGDSGRLVVSCSTAAMRRVTWLHTTPTAFIIAMKTDAGQRK